ncbi:hypothetical protein [Stutzerimonas balearica]|uniref:hypothetical protein n=1 Tax=Stutzerimonas balearica TaxID=74829 RepID=UPI00289C5993|nr:hypothetical protein [Stutzerimonas balearica]
MPGKKVVLLLILVAAICFGVIFAAFENGGLLGLANSLGQGFLISIVFYFVVVYLPEKKRRNDIYRNMELQYRTFKESCINTFLVLSNSQEYQNRENLLSQEEFRRYFKNSNCLGENRWDAVSNALLANEYYLAEIKYEITILNDELKFLLGSAHVYDEEAFRYFKRVSQVLHRLELVKQEYDDIKTLCRYLWSIFTGWSFVDGYKEAHKDMFLEMLSSTK